MTILTKESVYIPIDSITLEGILTIPKVAKGLVIFAHGSVSSRHSKRNNFVADVLNMSNIGTLLFDLLTQEEDIYYENRFDIALLSKRLQSITEWLMKYPKTAGFKIGYFGASTGAAAALEAAPAMSNNISAIVSRGGRVDLAKDVLNHINVPTLFIVGEYDDTVVDLNKEAFELLNCKKKLSTIPQATHLFEEPGALEEVACEWFKLHLDGKHHDEKIAKKK